MSFTAISYQKIKEKNKISTEKSNNFFQKNNTPTSRVNDGGWFGFRAKTCQRASHAKTKCLAHFV